jgi:hypothetical protein
LEKNTWPTDEVKQHNNAQRVALSSGTFRPMFSVQSEVNVSCVMPSDMLAGAEDSVF